MSNPADNPGASPAPAPANIGHLVAQTSPNLSATITIQPVDATETAGDIVASSHGERYEALIEGSDRLPVVYPTDPTPFNDRVPLPYELQGYVNVSPRTQVIVEQVEAPPVPEYVSDDAFEKIVEGFKSGDGKFLAMTAYGAVPLPDQMLQTIPEKFVTKPLVQEREVFVLKQDHRIRVTERDYTQYDHRFVTVPKSIVVDKIKAVDDVKVIEIPHFQYTPVVEDKIVEIPYGIKYVEVPVQVPCKMPPKIIPVPKPHIVERIIETTKPVVQEKIIEVPEIIKKKVPRVVIKEIPYVVPKYVEKIVEVPYKPGQELPTPQGSPMNLIPKPPPLPEAQGGTGGAFGGSGSQRSQRGVHQVAFQPVASTPTAEARMAYAPEPPTGRVEGNTLVVDQGPVTGPQTFYLSQGIKHIKLPYEARIDVTIVQEDEVPEGAPIAQQGVRYMAPGPRAVAYGDVSPKSPPRAAPDEPVYAGPMDPIIEHAAPGMRAIEFRTRRDEPDILTQQGVLKYSKFETCLRKDVDKLLPNLPHHDLVPMNPPGTPDWKALTYVHSEHFARMGREINEKEPVLKYRCL